VKALFRFTETDRVNDLVVKGAAERLTDEEFIVNEIKAFLASPKRRAMLNGEKYYRGEHDILKRQRLVIGPGGKLNPVENLPNNRIVDNQYKKMVAQKGNYLLGQPFTLQGESELYVKILKKIFDKRFRRLLKNVGKDSLNGGIGWLFVHYNDAGDLAFKLIKPFELIPGWRDSAHTALDYAIRIYEAIVYEGKNENVVQKVEIYDDSGIHRFVLDGTRLLPDHDPALGIFSQEPYFTVTEGDDVEAYNWSKIPLVPFKYNDEEIPLINNVKSLQDGLNIIVSNFQNNMEEDTRNTILVLVNYDGQDLGEFRRNLATYGAVKVKTVDGAAGDVQTLQVEVNAENYKAIIEIFKKAIIENAMGYDAKDDRLGGNANQMNIMSMYSDIDLDTNEMETEYQASFEELLYFVNLHLTNTGAGDFDGEDLEVIFNRDMLISESDIIENIQKSVGILSDKTLVAQHPWVEDASVEYERMKKQKEESIDEYAGAFPPQPEVKPDEER